MSSPITVRVSACIYLLATLFPKVAAYVMMASFPGSIAAWFANIAKMVDPGVRNVYAVGWGINKRMNKGMIVYTQ